MTPKHTLWAGLGVVALGAAGFMVWLLSLPDTSRPAPQPPIPAEERAATLAALKPPMRERPVVAIVGINDATETTDYLITYGMLRRADIGSVMLVATDPGAVSLYPALRVEPHATIAEFDRRYPAGADYVVVPAMSRDDDPAALRWIRAQAGKGATIIGVCAGAKVVAAAGLLTGKRATTHWYYLKALRRRDPSIVYVPDRRLVVDGRVATTTGITASIPMMLTLIEAVAGRERADAVARDVGLPAWDARHDSHAFRLTRPFATTVLHNRLAVWNREQLGVELVPGLDEVSLALVADAWSRTYRSRAVTFAGSAAVPTRGGATLVPDVLATSWPRSRPSLSIGRRTPVGALDAALDGVAHRYGGRTASVVAMQLEYPR